MHAKDDILLELRRRAPTAPHTEPVSSGVPFPRGMLNDTDAIEVRDEHGRVRPAQVTVLARWPDASVRWALLDFLVETTARTCENVRLMVLRGGAMASPAPRKIGIQAEEDAFRVDTGAVEFWVPVHVFAPFVMSRLHAPMGAVAARSRVILEDANGRALVPHLEQLDLEARGPLRLTFTGAGEFRARQEAAFCRFASRLSFFAELPLVRLELTVRNPRRAAHRGGMWDLGDPGSIYFRSLTIEVDQEPAVPYQVVWRVSSAATEEPRRGSRIEFYQASSGGESWSSRNHVDRSGNVPLPFRGCRIDDGDTLVYVDRPVPVVSRIVSGMRADLTFTKFWQQFPSALEGGPQGLCAGLFPRQFHGLLELQGGEQKTYTAFLQCVPVDGEGRGIADLAWVHDPLVPCLGPEHFFDSAAFAYFVPARDDLHHEYVALAQKAVDGPSSFFRKRETIDEYGWRHFGDTHADHEDAYFRGQHPVISHYNNQYDLLYGLLLHFARTADPRWFELAMDLAQHVIDIDIYHTTEDKPAYCGGLFWHTDHYQDAGRATHRSYSADSPRARDGTRYGGGPSGENNYTTGLLYFYYLTGEPSARRAVEQLADWVLQMDDGTLSILGCVDSGPTGLASCTVDFGYHGPGRGVGNSINAMVDAFRLTGHRRYLAKAEELIRRCIHPADAIGSLDLLDLERRWSYVVCLQAVGKYLDLKCELDERDFAFAFAQASLNHYAEWMAEHETPSMARFDRVEYPTESWPAQDVRKSCVFDFAAKYGPPEVREQMTQRAEYFFCESLHGLLSFAGHACTRPLAILLGNGVQRASFRLHSPEPVPPSRGAFDFGAPQAFESQKHRVRKRLGSARGCLKVARAFLRPSMLARLVSGRIW